MRETRITPGVLYRTVLLAFGLVVLGLIVWINLQALVVVLAAEINVVRQHHLYPRALLTPFTDDVDLTRGDKSTYAGAAQAQRTKEFEEVDVRFGDRRRPDR